MKQILKGVLIRGSTHPAVLSRFVATEEGVDERYIPLAVYMSPEQYVELARSIHRNAGRRARLVLEWLED